MTIRRVDLAANPGIAEGPVASASSVAPVSSIAEGIDGRLWFFPSNPNGWSPSEASDRSNSWYSVDFRRSHRIGSVELYFLADGVEYAAPSAYRLQYLTAKGWREVPAQRRTPRIPLANGENEITFPPLTAQRLRVVFTHPVSRANFRLIELKAFAP